MLLSGLTTWLSVMTASRSASIVGSNASSPGASRLSVSATSASCSQRPVLRGEGVDHPTLGQQPIGHAVLGQHPLDQPVLGQQSIDQAAGLDGAHQPAVLLRGPVQHTAGHGQLVHQAAGLQQPVDRTVRRQRPPSGWSSSISLASRFARSTASSMPSTCATDDDLASSSPPSVAAPSQRAVGDVEAGVGDGEPDPHRCGGEVRQRFAEVHVAQSMGVRSAHRMLPRLAWNQTHRKLTGFMQHYSK